MLNSPSTTLRGVRVIEWGNLVSAPFCGKVLGELGADVIKIEPPAVGDEGRTRGPFPGGVFHPEKSGLFLFANLNKRGITLNVESNEGRRILDRLLETADIFVENQSLSLIESLGLDYESLKGLYPGLVATSISPYGRTGPYKRYKGTDLTANAMSGLSFGTGHPHREPLTTPLHQASYLAGVGAAFASIVALLGRDMTGQGQSVDVAEAQVIGTLLTGYHLPTYIYRGVAGFRSGQPDAAGPVPQLRPALQGRLRLYRRAANGTIPQISGPAGRAGLDGQAPLPRPARHERPVPRGGGGLDIPVVHGTHQAGNPGGLPGKPDTLRAGADF